MKSTSKHIKLEIDEPITPFLRWAGSKRKIISHLSAYWNGSYDRYIEPFVGSACLFFNLRPKSAILSDMNNELINVYSEVCKNPSLIYESVISIPRNKQTYYEYRSKDPHKLSPKESTIRFIYLNRNCFNGIYRTNRRGQFNVPYASNGVGRMPNYSDFEKCAIALKTARLRACDFGSTLRHARSGDFVYLDPPYVVERRRVFKEYGSKIFTPNDISRLSEHLRRLNQRDVAFLVSYADCAESRKLAQGWSSKRVLVRRHISGFADARKSTYELMITNTRA